MSLKAYQDWKKKNAAVGCVFARMMAAAPARYGQCFELVSAVGPAAISTEISQRVATHVGSAGAAVVTLVFPTLNDLRSIVAVAQELGRLPHWTLTLTKLAATPIGACVAFGIVREIPFGTSTCPSEALVLGPFDEFPNTRRAPMTAMELFVGPPLERDPKTGKPTRKANLAHVDVSPLQGEGFQRTWKNSVVGRRRSLGINVPPEIEELSPDVDDLRAKAKVSFVIPAALATELGVV